MIRTCFNDVADFVVENLPKASTTGVAKRTIRAIEKSSKWNGRIVRPAPIAVGMKRSPNDDNGRNMKFSKGMKNRPENRRRVHISYGGMNYTEFWKKFLELPVEEANALLELREEKRYSLEVHHESWKKFRDHQWR